MNKQHDGSANDLLAHIDSCTKQFDCIWFTLDTKIGRTKVRTGALPEAPCGALQQMDAVARVARQVEECSSLRATMSFLSAVDHIS